MIGTEDWKEPLAELWAIRGDGKKRSRVVAYGKKKKPAMPAIR